MLVKLFTWYYLMYLTSVRDGSPGAIVWPAEKFCYPTLLLRGPPLPRGALWYLRCMYTWSMDECGITISLDGKIVMKIGWEEIWAAEDSIVGEWNE